ncbi:Transcriptional regulator PadR-like family protein [Ekhidna lutea]|uniref:Transcriptional regulator PadR-like family protein n=1 Tax=Ekhidna lutea TaxID=447679 RepID=A0A239IT11_EKHLU|nr:PadR family transcriptional regulator [Ekhidna lutea]SNS95554.1 Transcriptional regulator PadR-like family protein [Ekhidna lutea]
MEYQLGEFEELVLLTVAAQHNEAYGVSIHEFLTEETKKKINISAIHVALKRLEKKGFVDSRFGGITEERGGRRKKYYIVTALGKKVLDASHDLRTSIYQRIPSLQFAKI